MTDNLYKPSPNHPVFEGLRKIGDTTLVGSRSFQNTNGTTFWSDDSDFDYLLAVPARAKQYVPHDVTWVGPVLEGLGFERLPKEGGPYGRDQLVLDVWRLPSATVFGVTYPHVDVIACTVDEAARRRTVLLRIAKQGDRGGRLCRGIKAEVAWGAFWWATLVHPEPTRG